jgi:hypothetical protein
MRLPEERRSPSWAQVLGDQALVLQAELDRGDEILDQRLRVENARPVHQDGEF